jgi:phosphomannomutase
MSALPGKLQNEPKEIAGKAVDHVNRIDGTKLIFADGSWLLMRPSGTEPLVRIYAEAESVEKVEVLLEQGRKYLLG